MNKNKIPAVEKTIEIINLLDQEAEGLTQTEIIRQTGISNSTGYRIIQTLLDHGWIVRPKMKYMLGDRFQRNIEPIARIMKRAQSVLDSLAQKTRLSCKISVRRGNQQYSIMGAESPEPFTVNGKIGGFFPLIEGSVGAALLVLDDETVIRKLIAETPDKIQETTEPDLIFDRIKRLKRDGFVINLTKSRWKVHAMSVPVIVQSRVAAALTILGLKEDFSEQTVRKYADALMDAKQQLQTYAGEV